MDDESVKFTEEEAKQLIDSILNGKWGFLWLALIMVLASAWGGKDETMEATKDSSSAWAMPAILMALCKSFGMKKEYMEIFVVSHANKENKILYSVEELADLSGLEYSKLNNFFNSWMERDTIRRVSNNEYMMNPSSTFYGPPELKGKAIEEYEKLKKIG